MIGELIITEFMADPDQTGDSVGEYIEFFNRSDAAITMNDWMIGDASGNLATFSGTIEAGEFFVVGSGGEQMFTIPIPSSTEMFFRIDFEWPGS
jgi:hypothetical protein